MTNSNNILFEEVNKKIITLREQKIILDSDVALLYGVTTKEVNQAVKNNPDKFPDGYLFPLSNEEKNEVVKIFYHLSKLKFSPQLPKAFTEKGLYMLATILKSSKATQTTIAIIEAYSRIKGLARNIKELSDIHDKREKQNILSRSGEIIAKILEDDLNIDESETSVELNFAILKFKHTIKKKKKK
jgi:hypothetical protein